VADSGSATKPINSRPSFQLKGYEVLAEIARGGMGIVFKARQVRLNRVVALKMIRSGQIAGESEIQRFLIEAKAAATLQHPNIVAIHEIGEEAGQHFFSMDLIEGQGLDDFVRQHGLPPREAASFVKTIAEAIHYAHQRGILHRDLKPSNVLVDRNKQPHLTDFGLAKFMSEKSEVTASGAVMGSPSYMPPEQAEGRTNDITVRSDIYSLGAMLYHLLTGRPPFAADSLLATLKLVVESEPTAPRNLNSRIPRDLETICLKCLEKNPAKRFGTAQEVAEELVRFLTYRPIRARSLGPVARAWRWCRRRPAVATALVVFICGFIGVYWQWQRAEVLAIKEVGLRHGAEQASVEALLAQARVLRSSGGAGQRNSSLSALRKAAQLRPDSRIRDEIVACLPLVDLELARRWPANLLPSSLVAFNPQLSLYAQADSLGQVRITAAEAKEPVTTLAGTGRPVSMLRFSPNGKLLAIASVGRFAVWEIASRQLLFQMTNLSGAVVVDFSPENAHLGAGDASGGIRIYGLSSGGQELAFGIGRPCGALRFDPSGSRLAVSSRESLNLFVFNSGTGMELSRLPHPDVVNDLAWNSAGTFVASACADNQIYIWDKNGSERTRLRGHTASPQRIAFAHTTSVLASLGDDNTLRLWDAATGHPLVRWEGVSRQLLQFGSDDRLLACVASDSAPMQLQFLQVTWPDEVRSIPDQPSEAQVLGAGVLAENGRLLLVPVEEGIHPWDVATGRQLEPILMGRVQGIALPHRGNDLLVRGFYGVQRLPVAHAKLRSDLLLLGPPRFLDCAPGEGGIALLGEDQLAVCEEDGINLMAIESGQSLHKLPTSPGLKTIDGSADGKWVAASNWKPGGVVVWDSTGTTHTNLPVLEPARVAFSPDSKWLATATESRCQFWRVGQWQSERIIPRQRTGTSPAPLAFSPDGTILAWASADNIVSLIATTTGESFLSIPSPGMAAITTLQFTPSGGGLLVAAVGWPLTLWDLGSVQRKLAQYGLPLDSPRTFPAGWPAANQLLPAILANVSKIERTQNALKDLHRCESDARSHPDDFASWRQVASINSSFYRFAAAEEAYRQALRLNPQDAACGMEAGYVLVKLQRFPEAAEQYRRVETSDSHNLVACQQLAYLYLHAYGTNRDVSTGRHFAEHAFEIDPKDPSSMFWLGVARYRSGDFKEALELLNRAVTATHSSKTYYLFYQAMCLAKLGRTEEAMNRFESALDRVQTQPNSLVEHREFFESFINEARAVCAMTQ